jgi:hypothetical protein
MNRTILRLACCCGLGVGAVSPQPLQPTALDAEGLRFTWKCRIRRRGRCEGYGAKRFHPASGPLESLDKNAYGLRHASKPPAKRRPPQSSYRSIQSPSAFSSVVRRPDRLRPGNALQSIRQPRLSSPFTRPRRRHVMRPRRRTRRPSSPHGSAPLRWETRVVVSFAFADPPSTGPASARKATIAVEPETTRDGRGAVRANRVLAPPLPVCWIPRRQGRSNCQRRPTCGSIG